MVGEPCYQSISCNLTGGNTQGQIFLLIYAGLDFMLIKNQENFHRGMA